MQRTSTTILSESEAAAAIPRTSMVAAWLAAGCEDAAARSAAPTANIVPQRSTNRRSWASEVAAERTRTGNRARRKTDPKVRTECEENNVVHLLMVNQKERN